MSIIHNIRTKTHLNFEMLNEEIRKTIENVDFEYRGGQTFYYWLDHLSARGLDVSIEKKGLIEIRNTLMSNSFDYILTNKLIDLIISQTNGILFNEDGEIVNKLPVFDSEKIEKNELDSSDILYLMSGENDMSIFTPKRTIYFGKRLHSEFTALRKNQRRAKMYDIIQKCQYEIPEFGYGDILQVGEDNSKDKKLLKLLTNKNNCIIDKYDFIMFDCADKKPIMITNQTLNSILPKKWELCDEYTIIAPILTTSEWEDLKKRALEYDIFDEFIKK